MAIGDCSPYYTDSQVEELEAKIAEAAAFLDGLAHELDGDENVLADRCRAMGERLRK